MNTLSELLSPESWNINRISKYFNDLLALAVRNLNTEFSPHRLSKLPRELEPLPIDKRQLSSYRTRIGTMLEYALSTELARLLKERYDNKYLLTFAASHEYPDFYFRDNTLTVLLRIEMKAVDADSDEQAARFSTPTIWIDSQRDLLLLVGWKWHNLVNQDMKIVGEYPHIFASVILPAGEIASERDKRLIITGGKIEDEKVYVFSKKKGNFVTDPGNYGKFWRIVHRTRHNVKDLTETMQEFIRFLEQVDEFTPRGRLRKRNVDKLR